ncbi:lytic polysaccharide monooxygenase [Patellaria atrata CBS 101060]|uniref:Lytic polysaccharide monooxygenase n=1 Tax=Patellaria atrata CBS 101060 TaxID=1346257 RepID=A0A9P4VSG2_9PEZI|nr:lytic polysaccharide monooxygenase [Patellaria atrata CBS 101060]
MYATTASIFILSSLTPLVLGHARITNITADGVSYTGWDPEIWANGLPVPTDIPAWSTTNLGNNPLYPDQADKPNIICAKDGAPAKSSITIMSGHQLRVKWNEWPPSHKGPVIDYIAACNGPCSTVDKTTLKWVKIQERGWVNATGPEGTWAADELAADNFSWNIKIPPQLKAGEYVLRHEIIALHLAFPGGLGAEFYPQCLNLKVTGTGTKSITGGVLATTFYKGTEPGLALDIHNSLHPDYQIPGPAIWNVVFMRLRRWIA